MNYFIIFTFHYGLYRGDRGSILENFVQFEFIIIEFIGFRILKSENNKN